MDVISIGRVFHRFRANRALLGEGPVWDRCSVRGDGGCCDERSGTAVRVSYLASLRKPERSGRVDVACAKFKNVTRPTRHRALMARRARYVVENWAWSI